MVVFCSNKWGLYSALAQSLILFMLSPIKLPISLIHSISTHQKKPTNSIYLANMNKCYHQTHPSSRSLSCRSKHNKSILFMHNNKKCLKNANTFSSLSTPNNRYNLLTLRIRLRRLERRDNYKLHYITAGRQAMQALINSLYGYLNTKAYCSF